MNKRSEHYFEKKKPLLQRKAYKKILSEPLDPTVWPSLMRKYGNKNYEDILKVLSISFKP